MDSFIGNGTPAAINEQAEYEQTRFLVVLQIVPQNDFRFDDRLAPCAEVEALDAQSAIDDGRIHAVESRGIAKVYNIVPLIPEGHDLGHLVSVGIPREPCSFENLAQAKQDHAYQEQEGGEPDGGAQPNAFDFFASSLVRRRSK